jgi:hypothetical protein
MKHLFTATTMLDSANIEMLKGLLEEDEIRCMIRNEYLSSVPFLETSPELWILNDADYLRAKAMLDTWRTTRIEVTDSWACSDCGETIEGQFTSCWQCGYERQGARPRAG